MKAASILVLVLFVTVIKPVHAQKFRVGLTAGIAKTDVDGTDTRDNDNDFYKSGAMFGGFVNTKLSQYNVIQMEINYMRAGTMQPPDSNNNGYFKLELNYINVCFLWRHNFHFTFFKKNRDKFDFQLGASADRLVNYVDNVNGTDLTLPNGYLNSTVVSVFAGLAYNFTPNIALTYRYCNSLTSALSHSQAVITYPYYSSFLAGDNIEMILTLSVTFGSDGSDKAPADTTPTDSGQ
jgi:hypothetical protein